MLQIRDTIFCFFLLFHCSFRQVLASPVAAKASEKYISDVTDWECTSNSECTASSSTCIDNTCQCPVGYIFNTNMTSCVKVATKYGDDCTDTIQCSRYLLSGASCIDDICVCGPGYYYIHGTCRPYSGLFGKCQTNDDCYVNADIEATSCFKGVCQCSSGFYQREYRTCRPAGQSVGDQCAIDNDCIFSDTAQCSSSLVCAESETNYNTVQFSSTSENPQETDVDKEEVSVGSKCTTDKDCAVLGKAVCSSSGTCACGRAHFPSSTKTECVPELGESCKDADIPSIAFSTCRNGRWECVRNRVVSKSNQECLKVTRVYNKSCRFSEQCYIFGPDAVCENKKCICNEKSRLIENELFCWMKKGLGESCQKDIDCFVDGMSSVLSCTKNVCSCPEGTHINADGTKCIESSAGIGMACESSGDCAVEHTHCLKNVCTCIDNYYASEGQCLPGINATCTKTNDCSPDNSMCTSNICGCKEKYVAASISSCVPVVPYGKSCEHDVQCSAVVPNTACLSAEAEDTDVALSSSTKPVGGTCSCIEGYRFKSERCYRKRVLGESCLYRSECYLNSNEYRAVCKNERCACDWGYIQVNDTVCSPSLSGKRYINSSTVANVTGGLIPILLMAMAISSQI